MKHLLGRYYVYWEVLLGRFRLRNDFVGYKFLVEIFEKEELWRYDGDILEIGAFLGGGTRKLAQVAAKYCKSVLVVDVFDPAADSSVNIYGYSMKWIYKSILGTRDLFDSFSRNTAEFDNIEIFRTKSCSCDLSDTKIVFAFVDGGHDGKVVRGDFDLVWANLVPGGVVAFHDYGSDLPSVTAAIDAAILHYLDEVESNFVVLNKKTMVIKKRKIGNSHRPDQRLRDGADIPQLS